MDKAARPRCSIAQVLRARKRWERHYIRVLVSSEMLQSILREVHGNGNKVCSKYYIVGQLVRSGGGGIAIRPVYRIY